MDFSLFSLVNGLAGQWRSLDFTGIFFARYAIFLLPLFAFTTGRRWLATLVHCGVSAACALTTNLLISLIVFRMRPYVDHQANLLIRGIDTKSFPSDHTAAAFAIALSIFFVNRTAGIIAFAVAFLIGISRVFVGVHYPLDVLGGIVTGCASAFIMQIVMKRFGL
ncbi:MAG: phosphatase PAP2 family protein [bacterium]|nr:phosphatase PAP2 family protein [bacterium]